MIGYEYQNKLNFFDIFFFRKQKHAPKIEDEENIDEVRERGTVIINIMIIIIIITIVMPS